jgi:hypothetical protein
VVTGKKCVTMSNKKAKPGKNESRGRQPLTTVSYREGKLKAAGLISLNQERPVHASAAQEAGENKTWLIKIFLN